VGEQLMRRLWQLELVRSLPDLYRLTKEQLLELEGFQEKSASNAIEAIERSKRTPFSRVLLGLNIPDVGWVTAQNLARHFGSIERIAEASPEEIQEVEGIGPERAEAIAEWFSDDENLRLVGELREWLRLEAAPRSGRSRAAERLDLRHHRDARGLQPRRGAQGARGHGREGRGLGRRRRPTGVIAGGEPGSKLAKAQKGRRSRSWTSRR
jgi:DNA ligase (NAD+)